MKKIFYIIGFFLIIIIGNIFLCENHTYAMNDNGDLVIVLDPGHGGSDPGAVNSKLGIQEATINFKLATYAKQELEKYEGVKVYLTRYDKCPTIAQRGDFAKEYQADLVVSMHINSGASSARGAGIWVTQDNTEVEYYQKSKELGQTILYYIQQLGIQNNGVFTRSGQPDEWYESGVVKDYYGIIRYPMNYGIRSILVEHCFISNEADCQFINADAKIKNLALADVKGIVEAYNLKKKEDNQIPVKKLALDKTEINLEITSEDTQPLNFLNPIFTPQNAYNKWVEWYSSDPETVRVWEGRIRGLKPGEATITAITKNNQRIAKCKVVVTKPEVALKSISPKQTEYVVDIDSTGDVIINFNPTDASDKKIFWESSDPETVRVWERTF